MEIQIKQTHKPLEFTVHNTDDAVINVSGFNPENDKLKGFRPMELVLVSLGSCMSIDIVEILRKQKQEVEDYQVSVKGERADSIPKVFTKILIELKLKGRVESAKLERAIKLSTEKYCSVHKMLEQSVKIETSYKIEV